MEGLPPGLYMGPLELSNGTTFEGRPRTQTGTDSLSSSHSFCDPGLLLSCSVPRFPCLLVWLIRYLPH